MNDQDWICTVETYFRKLREALIRFLKRHYRTIDDQEREEILQDTFLHLLVYDTIRAALEERLLTNPQEDIERWLKNTLYRVARLKLKDRFEKLARRQTVPASSFGEVDFDLLSTVPSWDHDVVVQVQINERIESIHIPSVTTVPWQREALMAWWQSRMSLYNSELARTFGSGNYHADRTTIGLRIQQLKARISHDPILRELLD